jgi:hypothetical protein
VVKDVSIDSILEELSGIAHVIEPDADEGTINWARIRLKSRVVELRKYLASKGQLDDTITRTYVYPFQG